MINKNNFDNLNKYSTFNSSIQYKFLTDIQNTDVESFTKVCNEYASHL